jgi:hypothetical protein
VHWILAAWKGVKDEIIIKAFKKCSISNLMDGSEDDELWQSSDIDSTGNECDSDSD